MLLQRIKGSTLGGGRDICRTAKFFRVGDDIQRVQALEVRGVLFGFRQQVNRAAGRINDGRTSDADLRNKIAAAYIAARHSSNSAGWINEALPPQHYPVISVDGVQAIMFGGHVNYIVRPAGNLHVRQVERLGVDVAIERNGK